MVDPRVCPPKADVELADVVRRFGPQYTSQYGHRMMPSQTKASMLRSIERKRVLRPALT